MKLLVCSAIIGAALVAGIPLGHADTGANGPGCTAADLEFARAGVQEATAIRQPLTDIKNRCANTAPTP